MDLSILHQELSAIIEEQKNNWKSLVYAEKKGFYQGYDRIGIEGARPAEERLKHYDILQYFSKDKTALDIGCNCGFFLIHIAGFLKQADGVEINPYLIRIGEKTAGFLNVNNAGFYNSSFENFSDGKDYDLVFSLANDSTIDGNTKFTFQEYMDKIYSLLKAGGLLIFESQAIDVVKPELFEPKLKVFNEQYKILDDKMVPSNYPVNVKERRFLVLRKK